jgi:SET domain-containing protein
MSARVTPHTMPKVIIRSSAIHAAGCFAVEPIPAKTRILEYTGERMPHDEADKLYEGRPYTYLFGAGTEGSVIDGYGMAMYVNHSCTANCETEEDDGGRVWICSMRRIEAGEELTYDYFLYDGEGEAPCTCGTVDCRGTMYSPAEIRRQKRMAAKQTRAKSTRGKNKRRA